MNAIMFKVMIKSSFCPKLTTNSIQRRAFSQSSLLVGRIYRNTAQTGSQQSEANSVSRPELENHFCQAVEQRLGFTHKQCLHISQISSSVFASFLNSLESIETNVEIIASHFSPNDVFFNPQIFLIHPRTVKNRTFILRELGFKDLKIVQIDSCFREILSETPKTLKSMKMYDKGSNPLLCLMSNMNLRLKKQIMVDNNVKVDEMTFSAIRRLCLSQLLSERLDIEREKSEMTFDNKNSKLSLTPVTTVINNIDLLLNKYQMPAHRLVTCPFLMSADFDNSLKIFERMDAIAGMDVKQVCVRYPQLLDTKYETLKNNALLLKKLQISDEKVSKCVQILTLNTEKLEKRFQLLLQSEELMVFANSPRILRLVLHLKSAFERLERLKANGCLAITLCHLIGSKKYFENSVLRYGHVNTRKGVEFYLLNFLNVNYATVKRDIGCHPYSSRLNVINAHKVVEFFVGLNLTKEQIVNGVFIVLYDYEIVKYQFKQMFSYQELQPFDTKWKNDPFLLQLLIYYIEKNYSFTGNGVYVSNQDKPIT